MDFDAFVGPLGSRRFMAEVFGRTPVHLPAVSPSRPSFSWARMNDLLGIAPHWTEGNLKLVLNSQAVAAEHYVDTVTTADGPVRRADPAKVDLFLRMGASLVADAVEQIAPEIAAVTAMLGRQFTAYAAANIYCSFDNIQAFATHYDTHEVFALQCEGEKRWRLYEGRAAAPIEHPGPDAQRIIDATRGRVVMDVRLRPGDLLYIPRGVFHDAIADGGGSLHITYAVMPRTGLDLIPLLQEAMRERERFRAYLPSADDEGQALDVSLATLADDLAGIVRRPAFRERVADLQRRSAVPAHRIALPDRRPLENYARTNNAARFENGDDGTVLIVDTRRHDLGSAFAAGRWVLSRPAFSSAELAARFPHVPETVRERLITLLLTEHLFARYTPSLR